VRDGGGDTVGGAPPVGVDPAREVRPDTGVRQQRVVLVQVFRDDGVELESWRQHVVSGHASPWWAEPAVGPIGRTTLERR
jgi:hypothetical protein